MPVQCPEEECKNFVLNDWHPTLGRSQKCGTGHRYKGFEFRAGEGSGVARGPDAVDADYENYH